MASARSKLISEIKDVLLVQYYIWPVANWVNFAYIPENLRVLFSNTISVGDLVVDRTSYTVKNADERISLPKKEFELLYFLAQNPGKVLSRDDVLQNIWGTDVYVLARTVDVHIRKVREKIGEGYITTVKGVGYKFEHV